MDTGQICTVVEDLEYLRDVWKDTIPDAEIRRGSAALRRLLVEDELGRAWRGTGHPKQPTIPAPDLEAMLGDYPRRGVDCALAGGALHGGIYAAGITVVDGPTPPVPATRDIELLMNRPFTLSEYLDSFCAYVKGRGIRRRDLVKYMANVKGGVHLASNSHARKREQELIARVRGLEGLVNHHSKDGLFFELLSLGQSIGKSPDCARLIAFVRRGA